MDEALSRVGLALFFTRGMSVGAWERVGMMERELALYRALRPHLRAIHLVSYGGPAEGACRNALAAMGLGLVHNRWGLSLPWYQRQLAYWPANWKRGPLLIKTNQAPGGELAVKVARRTGAPLIARCGYLHSEFMARQHGPDSPLTQHSRQVEATLFGAATRVVVTTPAMARAVAGAYQVPDSRLVVIPNHVECQRFLPRSTPPPDPRRVICVGRLEPQKNLEALIRGLAGRDISLWLVGEGSRRQSLIDLARELAVPLHLLGNRPNTELPGLLTQAAAFVLPSLYEGHPKALLEAMACGLPVVGTRVPGVQEALRHGETGLLCDPTPDALGEAVAGLLADPARMARLGGAARREVVATLSLERSLERELALYGAILAERGHG